jgi:multiple sugar transport system substrate-binding protein
MHGSSLVDYAKRGLLVPLGDLAKKSGIDLTDAVAAAQTNIRYNNTVYAVPFDIHGALAHLNLDLWKKAGLTNADGTPKLPTSAAEFLADAQAMKEKTGKNFFATPRSGDQLGVHFFETLVEQQGGDVLNAAGTKATLDTPQAKTALTFMNTVFSKYADGKQTYDAAQQSFLNGNVGMLFNGTWVVDSNAAAAKGKFDYEVTSFPTLYQKPAVWSDGHTWVIPKHKTADPVKERAALEFIKYLYAHDKDWALGTGHISARTSVLNSAAYKAAPQRANYASTGTTVAHPVPHIANWTAVSTQLVKTIESIWFQGANVDTALKNGDQQIDSLLTK